MAAFVIPLTLPIDIAITGRFSLPDIIFFLSLPPLIRLRRGRLLEQPIPKILGLAFLWLSSAIFSDLVHETPVDDMLRGWAKIIVIVINFAAMHLLVNGNSRRLLLLTIGLGIGGLIKALVNPEYTPEVDQNYNFWKFGAGDSLVIFTLGLLSYLELKKPVPALLKYVITGLLAALNLYFNARSLFGFTAASAGFLFLSRLFGRTRLTPTHIVAIVIITVVGGYSILNVYKYAASSGMLGESAKGKLEAQSSGDLNILLAGRSEMLGSSEAIADAPLLGHGSSPKEFKYVVARLTALQAAGYVINKRDLERDDIPSHSHIFGAWVEAGVLGFVFWLYILVLALKAAYRSVHITFMLPIAAYVLLGLIWSVLFSPITILSRTEVPFGMCVATTILQRRSQKRSDVLLPKRQIASAA